MRPLPLLLAACSPASRWAETRAVCGFPEVPLDASALASPPTYPSEACVDAVLGDFDADVDALLAADGLSDPYGLVRGEPLVDTATGDLLWAAHALLAVDLGSLWEIDHGIVSDAFLGDMAHTARTTTCDALSGLLYDYVTSRIRRTAPGEDPDAAAGLQGRRLWLYDLPASIDGAAVLVHEARHRDGPDHVRCGGEPVCDRDRSGSIGFEVAVHALAERVAADEVVSEIERNWVEALSVRILD